MRMYGAAVWIIFNVFIINQVYGTGCRFRGDMATCVNTNLTYIPCIPGNIKTLQFVGNSLEYVTVETFQNITNPGNMLKLILTNNRIVNISKDAFGIFKTLSSLSLNKNMININDMRQLLVELSLNNNLEALLLNSMGRDTINERTFSLLRKTPAVNLFLEENGIERFTVDSLKRLDGIQELVLDNNAILEFELPVMDSLVALRISHNGLVRIPNFCYGKEGKISFTKNLTSLFLIYNRIDTITNDTFRCLPNLNKLQLQNNLIAQYPTMLLSHCPKITYFDAGANSGHNIKIYRNAFSSKTLQFLKIGFNGNALDVFESLPETFKGLPSLMKLELSYINMMQLSDKNVSDLFSPISTVTVIKCFSCHLQGNLNSVLKNKPNLTQINLKSNYFQVISTGTFSASSKITDLRLGMNKIGHFSPNALPVSFLEKLDMLDLSKNPFICDCNLVWLINWLKAANKSRLMYYPNGYTCASPARWANKLIKDVQFSYLECHPFSTIEWFGMIGGPLVLMVIIASVVLYRNRWNIKHYIYMIRKRREYNPLEGNEYIYDAFVAYSNSESDWVLGVLMPILEDEFNLKLCVHERDFEVGAFINDNIVERMKESKRVILLLSNSFAASDWCMFEMKVAHSMHIEDNVSVVVIMFEELLGRHINNPLKVLLGSTTYLEWTEDVVGRELFITKLKDSMGIAVNG